MSSNLEQFYATKAALFEVDFPIQRTRVTSAAWWWLFENFGLSKEVVDKINQLGFVLAGGAAACMLDIANGHEPICVPGDVDFFYKGVTEAHGYAVRQLTGKGTRSRSASLVEILEKAGFNPYYSNTAVISFCKAVGEKPFAEISADTQETPWGFPEEATPDWVPEVPGKTGYLQIIRGAEPGFMRWDTIGMLAKFTGALSSAELELENLLEASLNAKTSEISVKTSDGFTIEMERDEPDEIRKSIQCLGNLQSATPVGDVPVWHRFDMIAVCAEIDGANIIHHPATEEDRQARRIRLFSLNRSPVKLVNRLFKYQAKGFVLEPYEVLKIIQMAKSLTEAESAALDETLVKLTNPDLSVEEIRLALTRYTDDYNRDVEQVETLRTYYQNTLRSAPALVYGGTALCTLLTQLGVLSNSGKSDVNMNYFL